MKIQAKDLRPGMRLACHPPRAIQDVAASGNHIFVTSAGVTLHYLASEMVGIVDEPEPATNPNAPKIQRP